MHKKICLTSQASVGCTFVDWSIHFLSRQTNFYHADCNQWIELVSNPIDHETAHIHKKNHPIGLAGTSQTLDKFDQQDSGVFTVYPQQLKFELAANQINVSIDSGPDTAKKIIRHIEQDYIDLINMCAQRNTKIVYIDSSPEIVLYHTCERKRTTSKNQTIETNIWKLRESQALFKRLLLRDHFHIDFSLPHLWLDSRSLWTLGEETMHKILDYLELPMIPERLVDWLPIYKKWQHTQFKHLNFCYILPHIIDSIVNGWDYKFDNLTFEQEVVIQHCLLYQHNLNLKSDQLIKFPENAKDLHSLLKRNTHNLMPFY